MLEKNKLKISLVGFFGSKDEGVHIISKYIAQGLEMKGHEVHRIQFNSVLSIPKIVSRQPDIIHFIMCPTTSGLLATKIIHLLSYRSKVVISALQPILQNYFFLSKLKPNLIFTQSHKNDIFFHEMGYNTKIVANGVDLQKFQPIDQKLKTVFRQKYNIPQNKFVILHNASLNKIRNIKILESLLDPENHILLIGRIHEKNDISQIKKLQKIGFDIRIHHFDNIEEIYWLSDCYVFPCTEKKAAIEIPLSILEAMACNLPVVTTPYGAIGELFIEKEGFYIANESSDYIHKIDVIKKLSSPICTRKQVLNLSWDKVISQIEASYFELFT